MQALGRQESVVPLARNHVSHAPTGICYIPFIAGYQVNVCVFHRLPCGRATVDAHIEARRPIHSLDLLLHCTQQVKTASVTDLGKVKNTVGVFPRDNEAMALRNGMPIRDRECMFIVCEDIRRQSTEGQRLIADIVFLN
jgi:hypothetical protein